MIDDILMEENTAEGELSPPAPVLVIENQQGKRIHIDDQEDQITVHIGNSISICENNSKYRAVLFSKCSNCKIRSKTKLLKISFYDCSDCNVAITGGVVGSAEYTRCKNFIVDVTSDIPLHHVGQCSVISFYQKIQECIYVVSNSMNVSCFFDKDKYLLDTLFDEQVFTHICNRGATRVRDKYVLNAIEMSVLPSSTAEKDIWERMTY